MNFTKEIKEYLATHYSHYPLGDLTDVPFYCDYDDPPKNPVFPLVNITQFDTTTSVSKAGKDVITDIAIQISVMCDRQVLNGEVITPRTASMLLGENVINSFREQYGFTVMNSPAPYAYSNTNPDVWIKTYRMAGRYYAGKFYKT